MNPYYYDELPVTGGEEEAMLVLGVMLIIFGVIALFALVFALLRSFSLYSIAKRRGISKAWLAWIPVGCDWILGSLSDQYQHLAQAQVKSRRKILLTLRLVSWVLVTVSTVLGVASGFAEAAGSESAVSLTMVGMLPSLFNGAVGIAAVVFYHMCNYDLYRSCDPKNAVAYLVIGILIPVTEPFFYLVNRKKDRGMPHAAPAVPAVPVAAEPIFAEPAGPEL